MEPVHIKNLIREFRQYSREEMLGQLKKINTVTEKDGIAVCKKCGGAKMFRFIGYGKDCWLPIACKCERDELERGKEDAEIEENRKKSGIYGWQANVSFNNFPRNSENSRAYTSALNFCKNIQKVMRRGQGMYIYGETGTYKTLLALCIANFLLDVGIKVKFVEACDVLFPIASSYNAAANSDNANLIAECVGADVLILDNLGGDDLGGAKSGAGSLAQRRLAKLIEGRYGKSTVFTSNYSLEGLAEICHVKVNTVDRIREMATRTFQFCGSSYRQPASLTEIQF